MSLTYSDYVSKIATLCVVDPADTNYLAALPLAIDYAELRMHRELNLLSTVVRDTSGSLSVNSRNFTLPSGSGRFNVVTGINLLSSGVRVAQLEPVSLEFLDAAYPAETSTASSDIPVYFAMVTDQILAMAPAPGTAWGVEVVGEIRPTALSASNTTTYLSTYLPDAFVAASMVFMTGFQRNFGAQADDPKMAVSWESQYQTLMQSASIEEHRKRWQAVSWTTKAPSPVAIPQRG